MDSGLTLEAAKKAIRQREAVHEKQQTLNGSSKVNTDVDAVGFQRKARPKNRPAGQQRHGNRQRATTQKCGRCGRERHPRNKCPARDAECYHWTLRAAKKTSLSFVRGDEDNDESAFLERMTDSGKNAWIAHISINGTKISFKLDTGADVTAVSNEAWEILGKPVLGQFPSHLTVHIM